MTSKRPRKSATETQIADVSRLKGLRHLLEQACDEALARVRRLRKEELQDAVELPADDLDIARSLEDLETDAGLIERYEFQLKAIDAAFSRLERGRYGICEKCKQEIPIERLKAVPFAAYCVACQTNRNELRRPGEGEIDEPSIHVWTPPKN
jgi:RNA polymerase-binding transcription factor